MPEIRFTKEDLLSRKQLKAGWRTLKVKSVTEAPGKNDPESLTWPTVFIVDSGDDVGVPVRHWFSEKAMDRVAEFVKCFIAGGNVEADKSYKLEDTVGRKVEGYVEYDIKAGWNTIKDFKPAKA